MLLFFWVVVFFTLEFYIFVNTVEYWFKCHKVSDREVFFQETQLDLQYWIAPGYIIYKRWQNTIYNRSTLFLTYKYSDNINRTVINPHCTSYTPKIYSSTPLYHKYIHLPLFFFLSSMLLSHTHCQYFTWRLASSVKYHQSPFESDHRAGPNNYCLVSLKSYP